MARQHRNAALAALFLTLALTTPARAGVIVGSLEWFQPSELTNYSWDQFNAVCGGGLCSGAVGGTGPDVTGWQWASAQDLGDLFLAPISGHPGGVANYQGAFLEGVAAFELGFERTTTLEQAVGFGVSGVLGFTATLANVNEPYWGGFGVSLGFQGGVMGSDFFSDQTDLAANRPEETVGAWLYRAVPVPLPGSAPLFLTGLVGLLLRGRAGS
ncbi:MAG: hypothetical protein HKN19_15005 [Halioglobus sp.]|nr:hypothetical protein [Halioglobus sp.]